MQRTAGKAKMTALYERLSRDDDLVGESNSITKIGRASCRERV